MTPENKLSLLEQLASAVEKKAEETSNQFHGQKLLYPNPNEGILGVLISDIRRRRYYKTSHLLAIFEDQTDGSLTIIPKGSSPKEKPACDHVDPQKVAVVFFRQIAIQPLPPDSPRTEEDLKKQRQNYLLNNFFTLCSAKDQVIQENLSDFEIVTGVGVNWNGSSREALILGISSHNGEILEVDCYAS
ncbi:hypothetical protein M1437_04890 [Patescibacteria group bacterium]|nr:hypothetical protein [Patescibacteria group bacterium]